MANGRTGVRVTVRTGEALVLRTWPFAEADLLVSLFTREHGRIKGVARHAMRSRRRFGGALEPMTHVQATWAERPREELVRLDAFEIVHSPLVEPLDPARLAGLELMAEVLDELPEGAVEDAVFRLSIAVLREMQVGQVGRPATYFCLWMNRLMGWMPELGRCVVCGRDLRGEPVWYSGVADGVTCEDDRRGSSLQLSVRAAEEAGRVFREPVAEAGRPGTGGDGELLRFAVSTLERHLERRLRSAAALERQRHLLTFSTEATQPL